MTSDEQLILFHAVNTRSSAVLALLEELGVSYQLKLLDLNAGEQRQSAYLAVNPMGKVPAIRHGDALVTEQVAIFIYLADRFPEAKLAPLLADPLRGPYLRWLVYYAACFEPAVIDRALKREPGARAMSPYGDFETMLGTLTAQLAAGPYILGEKFSAADILWGSALTWTTSFKLVPELPEIRSYIGRISARPSVARARERDAQLTAAPETIKAEGSAGDPV
ncbi:MAG: glutathione S-transferase family protein [Acidisphaera sp.]|nr:glutathione S-transferase family protein [Acidisphaera sp.]